MKILLLFIIILEESSAQEKLLLAPLDAREIPLPASCCNYIKAICIFLSTCLQLREEIVQTDDTSVNNDFLADQIYFLERTNHTESTEKDEVITTREKDEKAKVMVSNIQKKFTKYKNKIVPSRTPPIYINPLDPIYVNPIEEQEASVPVSLDALNESLISKTSKEKLYHSEKLSRIEEENFTLFQ